MPGRWGEPLHARTSDPARGPASSADFIAGMTDPYAEASMRGCLTRWALL